MSWRSASVGCAGTVGAAWYALALAALPRLAAAQPAAEFVANVGGFLGPGRAPGGYPLGPFTVGTFAGLPTGVTIVGATLAGTFGEPGVAPSAPTRVFLDGLLVAECVDVPRPSASPAAVAVLPCGAADAAVPWQFTLAPSEFARLAHGTADLTAIQDAAGAGRIIRLGDTVLRETYLATVAEPSPVALAAAGLGALAVCARRAARAQQRRTPTA